MCAHLLLLASSSQLGASLVALTCRRMPCLLHLELRDNGMGQHPASCGTRKSNWLAGCTKRCQLASTRFRRLNGQLAGVEIVIGKCSELTCSEFVDHLQFAHVLTVSVRRRYQLAKVLLDLAVLAQQTIHSSSRWFSVMIDCDARGPH